MTQCLDITLDSWGFGFCVFLLLCAIMWEFHIYSQKCVALLSLILKTWSIAAKVCTRLGLYDLQKIMKSLA